jgi:hypothetical protein
MLAGVKQTILITGKDTVNNPIFSNKAQTEAGPTFSFFIIGRE